MPRDRGEKETSSLIPFYSLIAFIVLFDQAAKWLATQFLSSQETFPLIEGIFHLTYVLNSGIAFGFFRNHPTILLICISLSIGVLFLWGTRAARASQKEGWCISLILGGAIGNWIDRVRLGAVVDFLDFRFWPVFNIADSAITVGVILYLILLFKAPR